MVNKYLINMVGIGEHYHMLIDKDLWDWLDYQGKKPCPKRLVDKMWERLHYEHEDKDDMIKYYRSVPPDERAAYITELSDVKYFNIISDLVKYVNANKIKIKDEMDLDIY